MFPVVIEAAERRKRESGDEGEEENSVYDSANNHHAVFQRKVEVATKTVKPNIPNEIIDFQTTSGT